MPVIQDIAPLESFFEGEFVTELKMNTEIVGKVNTLINNQFVISTYLDHLLQGSAAGADQAETIFVMATAPNGWTRDTFATIGSVLRSCDSTTVPPGSSPSAVGGSSGGSWNITGFSALTAPDHTHSATGHKHYITHTHTSTGHTHGMNNHNHTIPAHTHPVGIPEGDPGDAPHADRTNSATIGLAAPATGGSNIDSINHSHYIETHVHGGATISAGAFTMSTTDTNNTATAQPTIGDIVPSYTGTVSTNSLGTQGLYGTVNTTGPAAAISTSYAGAHSHNMSSDSSWRPVYTTSLICWKD